VPKSAAPTPTSASEPTSETHPTSVAPGLTVVAAGVAAAYALHQLLPSVSPLMLSLLLGALLTNVGLTRPAFAAGLRFSGKRLLRIGLVLLGLQLAVPQVVALGGPILLLVVGSVAASFAATLWLARRLGLSAHRSLLVATGSSICGASAVVAVHGVFDSEEEGEEDVMAAIGIVTVFGSLSILALPLVGVRLGLDDATFGMWAGASIHEVAQVVAAASAVGPTALAPAVVVKLARVVLLAPLVAGVSIWARRSESVRRRSGAQPPIVPLFVIGFLAATVLRSTGVLPGEVVDAAAVVQTVLLSGGMFAMGASVRLAAMVRGGGPGLLVGLVSTLLIAALSLAGLLLLT